MSSSLFAFGGCIMREHVGKTPTVWAAKETAEAVQTHSYLDQERAYHRMGQQTAALRFLFVMYGVLGFSTIVIIFFQGFHVAGFSLDIAFLKWLGATALGEVGGLALMVFGCLFKRD